MKPVLLFLPFLLLASCSGGFVYRDAAPMEFADFSYSFATKFVTVRGLKISCIDEGTGPRTLLLVHGLASNAGFWRYNIGELSKTCRVIAVDLPGYGKSDKGVYPYTPSFYADILAEMMRQLGVGKFIYLGHSMGGQIGIHFALRHPDRLEKLILASPAGIEPFTRGEGDWMKSVMTIDFIRKTPEDRIRANLAGNFYTWNDRLEWMVEERARMAKGAEFENFCYAVVRCVHGMLDEPTTKRLKDITVPTNLIFGEKDGLIPNPILHGGCSRDVAQIALDAIPGATLTMIPEAGHLLMIEKAEDFDRIILGILRP